MIGTEVYVKVILCLSLLLQSTEANFQLELVQVIFRHGDRTPTKLEIYPKAPHNPIYDKLGYGQLTEVGEMREYNLGKQLREMYGNFLGNTHRYGDVYGISTDFQRTKMSLLLVLNGLSNSLNKTNWPSTTVMTPVPLIVDTVLFPMLCPEYINELYKVQNSAAYHLLISKHKDLFQYLEMYTGNNMTDPLTATTTLYQYLSAQKSLNIPFPSWATEAVQRRIEEVVQIDYIVQSYTPKMKRLLGGMLVKEFIENMNFNENTSRPKIYLYSGHEINVAAFAKAHGFKEPRIPLYGSAIIVEKLRNIIGKHFVRMYLWTGVTKKLITYVLPGCTILCPYERYIKLMEYVTPTNKESNCMWNNITKDNLRQYYSSYQTLFN